VPLGNARGGAALRREPAPIARGASQLARRAELIAGCLSEAIHCTHFGLAVAVVSVAASLALRGPTRRRLVAFDRAAALVVLLAQERRAATSSRHPYR